MTNHTNKLKMYLANPAIKRLAIAVPLGVGIGLQRAKRIQQVREMYRHLGITEKKCGIYILMCSYFFATRAEPSEPAVKLLLSHVQTFGLLAVLAVPTINTAINWAISRAWPTLSSLALSLLSGMAFYSMALWLVAHKGDDLYKWVLAHPNNTAIGAATLAIVWMIFRCCDRPSFESPSLDKSAGIADGMITSSFNSKPTERDSRYIAAHEAGHALVYAALGDLPDDVKLAINDHEDERGALGFLTGVCSEHRLDEKSFVEWHMLVFLAGKHAEKVMLGESTLGSSNDHLHWLRLAHSYLANHYRGMYYSEPQNRFEQEQNETKLEALQNEQLAMLRTFFDTNTEVFKQLANTLLETRTMHRDELVPFLSRVQLPPGFPLPFGPFESFASKEHGTNDSSTAKQDQSS